MNNAINNVASPNQSVKRSVGKMFQFLARKLPFIPGKFRAFLQKKQGVCFSEWDTVFIGEDVLFDDICPENISVGRNVRITAGVRILTHYFDTKFQPTELRPFRFYQGSVVIEDNVFIGMNTVIASPITIGKGAIVGANSVVTRDIPANAIAVGSPAKVIGFRPVMKEE